MFKLRSIKIKLLIFFLLISLVPLVGGGILNVNSARQDLKEEISNKLTLFAEATEGQIFAYLDSIKSRTIDFSSDGFIRDSTKEIVKNNSTQAVGDLNEHLRKNKQVLDPTLAGILIVDLKGKIVASTDEKEIGKDESDDEYFLEGQKGVFVIDDIKGHKHFGLEKPIIVAAPLTDKETREPLGVLVNVFKTDKLSAIFSGKLQKESGAISSSLDRIGTLEVYLVGPDKEMIVHPSVTEENKTHVAKMQVNTVPVQDCLGSHKETIAVYLNYDQKEVIGASMCLVERNWTLLVEVPTKDAFASIAGMEARLAGLAGLLVTIVVLASLLFATGITGPIKTLHEATEIIAQGNLDYRVNIKTGDEIEQLNDAFNEMAGKLQQSYSGLEEKVREKTKELAVKLEDLEKANKSLGNTEKAMLNILEDARVLEKQLAEEKTSVERKVEERTHELKEEQARLQASIDSLRLGFIMTDVNCEILTMNATARRILCQPQDDSVPGTLRGSLGMSCNMQDVARNLKDNFDLVSNIKVSINEKKPLDFRDIAFGNRFLHIFISPIVMLKDHLEIIGAVILVEDITEAKILERSRDEFFSIASHELRTPLTAIMGNTSMIKEYLAEEIKNPQLMEMINDIHDSSDRLITIVNDFLNVSRLEMGKMTFKKESFDVVQIIKDVLQNYQVTGSRRKLYLKFDEPKVALPQVSGDQDRMRQVLINLVGNGLKFTQEGGVTVTALREGKFVKISVTDTGMGISEKNQELLFRKFQQAESDIYTRDTVQGTGLGLYISKLMVGGMGGKIVLEKSEVGKGTTFSFTLPIAPSQ